MRPRGREQKEGTSTQTVLLVRDQGDDIILFEIFFILMCLHVIALS